MENRKEGLAASEQNDIMEAAYQLVKTCPFLDMDVNFDWLDTEVSNIGVLSTPGSVVEARNIMGGFSGQVPFILGYQGNPASDTRKLNVVKLLNDIGSWLGGRKVTVKGQEYRISEYPQLSEGRKIRKIEQKTVPYISAADEKGTLTYICEIILRYEKED